MADAHTVGNLVALSDIPHFRCANGETFGATVAKALTIESLALMEAGMARVAEFPAYYPLNQLPGGQLLGCDRPAPMRRRP